jgi:hypothetical protein
METSVQRRREPTRRNEDALSAQQVPARAQRLYSLWRKLSDAPMTEAKFHAAILSALDRGPGSEADASAFAFLLTSSAAVTVGRGDDGQPSYLRAPEFPEHPPNGPGTAALDRQLAEIAAEEQRQHDRVAEEVVRNSPQQRQRAELIALIDARIDAKVEELRRSGDSAAIARAREMLRRQTAGASASANTTRPG